MQIIEGWEFVQCSENKIFLFCVLVEIFSCFLHYNFLFDKKCLFCVLKKLYEGPCVK